MTNIETQICNRLPKLRNYIKSRVGTPELAEDLYGEAVLKILRKARNGSSSLDAFMWICAKTVISDYFKTEGVRRRLLENDYVYCVNMCERSPEKAYETLEEIKAFMGEAREKLNSVYRKTLILLLFQNMDHNEIADTLAMPRATISTYLLRMRRRLGGVHLNKVRVLAKEN